ncbi:hypothetical protein DYBT9275_05584 [Dyadobacter sp. CECT 9275]|uniref:SGNH hydrolase-type esterase domain-containing protein n=1 Tax=Dyadobacter helix TaxID=2822344 RepID=A0A916NEH2_9BACT|nr:SGNH/GDSL hydrolase family protein [Dyadobacter sp. CECT 9275]CAG5016577.1 hypothetical protein DYBT9275_05584 [Dyadobacter sp. CECT 9275]
MKLHSLMLLTWVLLTGCKAKDISAVEKEQPAEQPEEQTTQTMSYLALGDSYTIGQSVSASERWPVLLAEALNQTGKKIKIPDIIATTGWTTADLLNALTSSNPRTDYNMVSLLIGVNNQYQGRTQEEFRMQFRQLLTKCITYAGGDNKKVFVVSIPDWGVTPYGSGHRDQIALEVDLFNQIAKEESEKAKVLFIDITPLSRTALNDPSLIAPDGLHFSGTMYKQWVDIILPKVKTMI